ncbi:3-deoxy-7-phosphoheptulonate synthase [Actinoplanes sp. NPDC051494]|uniref:3-deoxy-7-phosphoheptulonate synthase n=1 Tax=Actinoplanes sp. NPDC051494 TaxID=3363907 RepID=UPI003794F2AD
MTAASHDLVAAILSRPAAQQPTWPDPAEVDHVRAALARAEPLVRPAGIAALRGALARVAAGEASVIQAGDCAEDPAETAASDVQRKTGLLDMLAGRLQLSTHHPVLRAGRLAGQFAKPRTRPTETVGDRVLPVYRGHAVNGPEPDSRSRRPDPRRLLLAHQASGAVLEHLGWGHPAPGPPLGAPVWTSHEALLLDYELPQVRRGADGGLFLSSTHWPWLGDRTRQLDGAHVALLAAVANPVACKVGPGIDPDDLLALCARLDPDRSPGRLTLIARLGAAGVTRLPGLVRAVRRAGHPAIWLVDPMHGNTVVTAAGLKTRYLEAVMREVREFQDAVRAEGAVAGGLHLETTPDDVTECVTDRSHAERVGDKYTTLCDPRLNPDQALTVVGAWNG